MILIQKKKKRLFKVTVISLPVAPFCNICLAFVRILNQCENASQSETITRQLCEFGNQNQITALLDLALAHKHH